MTIYYYDTEPQEGIEGLCKRMTGNALQSPFRSTVPLLSLVEHSPNEWRLFSEFSGIPIDSPVHLEYRVPSPKPGGNPSQTDALLFSESKAVAVEAKWTEPRYPTVAKRISRPESDGADPQRTVNGWLEYFRPFVVRNLQIEDFLDVVYQVLHRAASAYAVAAAHQRQPVLTYVHFHPSASQNSATTEQYVSDFTHLYGTLGKPSELEFSVVEMPLEYTALFRTGIASSRVGGNDPH